ncbi:hypothetical protein C1Y63_04930 [Corynebacterium sp. 13CS0277]|uniref:WhiB family transcriptional regulator n=1 Tax=Corynebacterium sp. 13CS0277 TaxID=2071994 RepID=UPI000D04107D|nr:WhiB family transcriptional regulator [Corynebacterium sp. 13CS0277]PRQ11756.1 hypothetical protein C1Y63_04930 [Corynebacterium sp. 13CS0277]
MTTTDMPLCAGRSDEYEWNDTHTTDHNIARLAAAARTCGSCPVYDHCHRLLLHELHHHRPSGVWAGRVVKEVYPDAWKLARAVPERLWPRLAAAIGITRHQVRGLANNRSQGSRTARLAALSAWEVSPDPSSRERSILTVNGRLVGSIPDTAVATIVSVVGTDVAIPTPEEVPA